MIDVTLAEQEHFKQDQFWGQWFYSRKWTVDEWLNGLEWFTQTLGPKANKFKITRAILFLRKKLQWKRTTLQESYARYAVEEPEWTQQDIMDFAKFKGYKGSTNMGGLFTIRSRQWRVCLKCKNTIFSNDDGAELCLWCQEKPE